MLKVRGNVVTFNRGDDICLKINVYDSSIDFLKINDCLMSLKDFINDFKIFLNS